MTRRIFSYAYAALVSAIGFCLAIVGPLIAAPVMSFIRDAPAAALFLFNMPGQLVDFVKISILKPVYRESYETHGLSLPSVRL